MIRFAVLLALAALLAPFATAESTVEADFGVEHVDVASRVIVGKASLVRATVRNAGTVDGLGEIDFRYADGAPLASTGAVGYRFSVPAKSTRTLELAFTPPIERRGDAEIVVTVRVANDGRPENNEGRLSTFFYAPALALAFEAPASTNATPGGTTFLRYRIDNLGNGADRPSLSTTVAAPWVASIATPLPEIPAGGRLTGVVLLGANTSISGVVLDLKLKATSGIDIALAVERAAPELVTRASDASRPRSFAIEGLPERAQIFENETIEIPFDLVSAGAREVVNVTSSLDRVAGGWTAGVTPTVSVSRVRAPSGPAYLLVDLEPGERTRLILRLSRALDASATAPSVRVRAAALNERLLDPATVESANVTATIALEPARYDLGIVAVDTPSVVYRGDGLPISLTVENFGREPALAARARLDLRDMLRSLESTMLEIPALAPRERATLAWSVPSTAGLSGSYSVVATVETGVGDADRRNDAAVEPLHVRNPRLAVHAPPTVDAVPGAAIRLESANRGLAVENRGDRGETLHVALVSSAPWLAGHWTIDVPAGAKRAVPLVLAVPRFPHTVEVEATVTATLANRSAFTAHGALTFVVNDSLPPVVEVLALAEGRPGVSSVISARADDETGIARGELIVVDPDGGRVALTLARVAGDETRYETVHRPARAGPHTLVFRFEEATPRARVTTVEVAWAVANASYRGFAPVDFEDGVETSAAEVRFEERVPGTTRSVSVDLGDGPRPLLPPYAVALDRLPEGPVVLALSAVGTSGASWEGAWRVVIDRTPPAPTEPEVAAAGRGRVLLSVVATASVSVTARFESPAGVTDVSLKPARDGRFEAEALAPAGWDRVVFVARDAAGNAGSVAVEPPAAPPERIPFPAFAAVLAGLLAAGLRRRNRT